MSKIITLTFSPSIDKNVSVAKLVPKDKLRCLDETQTPGGGGINVARVIHRLGGDVEAVFPEGGATGALLKQLLAKENIPLLSVKTKNETRENFAVLDQSNNKQYRMVMSSVKLFEKEWKKCLEEIDNLDSVDFIVVSGSLPANIPLSIIGKLAKISKNKNAKLVIDTSGKALKKALYEEVYLLKPNQEELAYLLNVTKVKKSKLEAAIKKLLHHSKCKIIAVSLGEDGAMLVTKDETHIVKPPSVKVKSTVGAGDSMVAGIVFGLSKNESLKNALAYGVACGTATTMKSSTALCQKVDVDELLKKMSK